MTSDSSQGHTADRVIVHVPANKVENKLVAGRFAYGTLSRARYEAEIPFKTPSDFE